MYKTEVDTIAAKFRITEYWELVKSSNPANNKPYHNLWHTSCVTHYCYEIGIDEGLSTHNLRMLVLSAMFHDYGHHSKDDWRNIVIAKKMLDSIIFMLQPHPTAYHITESDIDEIHEIIDATQFPYDIHSSKLKSLSQKIIRDADLLQWTESTITEHTFAGLAEELDIPLHEFLPKNKEFILGIDYQTSWANKRRDVMLPIQMRKLDVFEKMIKGMGNRRIVLVARAASGKDFLRDKFMARNFKPSISVTTRPPRPGEVYGKDYFFISESEANMMIENHEFYEYVKFNNWLYGTTNKSWYEDDVFIMTPAGISLIKPEDRDSCFIIFLDMPEDIRKLRLLQRQMPGDTIDRRIEADNKDFENFTDFDIRITNSQF